VIAVIGLLVFLAADAGSAAASPVDSVGSESWDATTPYPTEIWTQSCVTSDGYIYCVGGLTGTNTVDDVASAVYYAPLSPSGIGQWTNTTSYPIQIRAESCVAESSTIYCVGGYTPSLISSDVYYASLSSSGVGQWTKTTSYPAPVWTQSCAASGTGIYCVGGITSVQNESSSVYFAPFSSSGIGQWTSATSYPVGVRQQSCVTSGSDLYCVGGYGDTAVYYAPLTPSGLGQWAETTGYPFTTGVDEASCATLSGEIYCVGGYTGPTISLDVYQAALSSSGVGQWTTATDYPLGVWSESCVASGGIYCVGGASGGNAILNSVYYMGGQTTTQSTQTTTQSTQTTTQSTQTTAEATSQSVSSTSSGTSSSVQLGAIAIVDGIVVVMVAVVGGLYWFRVRGDGPVRMSQGLRPDLKTLEEPGTAAVAMS
jgi:hypothetical protein